MLMGCAAAVKGNPSSGSVKMSKAPNSGLVRLAVITSKLPFLLNVELLYPETDSEVAVILERSKAELKLSCS